MPLKRPGRYPPKLERLVDQADKDWHINRAEDGGKRSRYIEDEAEEASCDEVEDSAEEEEEITPAAASSSKAPPVVDNEINKLLHGIGSDKHCQQQRKKFRKAPSFHCTPCGLEFQTLAQRTQHVGSGPHQRKVRRQNQATFKRRTCDELFPLQHNLDVHSLSRRHSRKIKYLKKHK